MNDPILVGDVVELRVVPYTFGILKRIEEEVCEVRCLPPEGTVVAATQNVVSPLMGQEDPGLKFHILSKNKPLCNRNTNGWFKRKKYYDFLDSDEVCDHCWERIASHMKREGY